MTTIDNKGKSNLDAIKKYIDNGELSFLIGAGFSRNVNKDVYPLWGELLDDAVWEMFGSGKRTKQREIALLRKVEKDYGYLGVASMIVKNAGYHEAIDTYIERRTPYIKTVDEKPTLVLNGIQLHDKVNPNCHLLLKSLNIQNIYTFNYDNALEFFLGYDEKRALENKIEKLEDCLAKWKDEKYELEQQELSMQKDEDDLPRQNPISISSGTVENGSVSGVSRNEGNNNPDKTKDSIQEYNEKINVSEASIETYKQELENYYNVVDDSYKISLSSKRKNIYKIHGSLREEGKLKYGFDGDSHTQYIITQEDYDTYNEKHGAFVSMMRIDLLRNRFCILGVSGSDANFLAWINWVKDVLDKSKDRNKRKENEKHLSYFIYSGNEDLKEHFLLMLHNHFIEPVILKNIFPLCNNDEERVKAFLEYVQPMNDEAKVLTNLWSSVKVPGIRRINGDPIAEQTAKDLFILSERNKFHLPYSITHDVATDVQFAGNYYMKENAAMPELMTFAAALKSSMMPLDITCGKEVVEQMEKTLDKKLKEVFNSSFRRIVLLQNLTKVNKRLMAADAYTSILKHMYNYRFPTVDEVNKIDIYSGIDFVRKYSLLHFLHKELLNSTKCKASDFASPQELVLVTDWLKFIGYRDPVLYKKADNCKRQYGLVSLYDYCQSYLRAMQRKEEISSYGNVMLPVYWDKYPRDVTNAAVLLNSLVELGVFNIWRSVLTDVDWMDVVRALKQRYAAALIFYTITGNGQDRIIKAVAQEIMYNENSRAALAGVLKNIIKHLTEETTPISFKSRMAKFATEVLPAVDKRNWSRVFFDSVWKILDDTEQYGMLSDTTRSIYSFVAKALEYVKDKKLRLNILSKILDNDTSENCLDTHHNLLVIAARKWLKPPDFRPLYKKLIAFIVRLKETNNQQGYFIVMNLMVLLNNDQKLKVLKLLVKRSLQDAFLTEGYSYYVRNYPQLANSFKKNFIIKEDLWHSGISADGISIGMGFVNVNTIDKNLKFSHSQLTIICNDMKMVLKKIDNALMYDGRSFVKLGNMSLEKIFVDILSDMRMFVHRHLDIFEHIDDFKETHRLLLKTYSKCFYEKDIMRLIADDDINGAIRKIIVEIELNGIDNYHQEYEQFLGRIITKDSKELNTLFRHINWAIIQYVSFFNNTDFIKLFETILNVYQPYFDIQNSDVQAWDIIGCQKEVAENVLMSISRTLDGWGIKDDFWSKYKNVFS